ncbi:MAG TPA: sugar phosphate isomerase/epimerase family protein [Gemmataceae bacterium]|nr:sugar phosphate isomerase/epimerase family protein [Gemmataceae bacterium]
MSRLKIGVRLESLGLPLRQGLAAAARLGVPGVRVDAVGDLSPNRLSETGRREFRHLLRSHNLELVAVGCPLRRGLDAVEDQQPRIEHVRRVMTLSYDLGPRVTIVEAGAVPGEGEGEEARGRLLTESLTALAAHGDRIGAILALETGLESGEALNAYLARFDSGSLGANLDPANLLTHGFDVYESARALDRRIVRVTARDARLVGASRTAQEVPLGHGDVEWMQFLGVLEEVEYRGWMTVVREADVAFLRRLIG